jgi:hypothetical protein
MISEEQVSGRAERPFLIDPSAKLALKLLICRDFLQILEGK